MEELRDYDIQDLKNLEAELDESVQTIKTQLQLARQDKGSGIKIDEEWYRRADYARRRLLFRLIAARNELARRRRDRKQEFNTRFEHELLTLIKDEIPWERFSELREQALSITRKAEEEAGTLEAEKMAKEYAAWKQMSEYEEKYRAEGHQTYADLVEAGKR